MGCPQPEHARHGTASSITTLLLTVQFTGHTLILADYFHNYNQQYFMFWPKDLTQKIRIRSWVAAIMA